MLTFYPRLLFKIDVIDIMKKLYFSRLFFSSVLGLAAIPLSAETFLIYKNSGSAASWTEPSTWNTGSYSNPVETEYYPGYYNEETGVDMTDAKVIFPGGNNNGNLTLHLDANITIGSIGSETGMFNVTINMVEQVLNETEDYYVDSALTIKATDPAAEIYDFINVGCGLTIAETKVPNSSLSFEGGTLNLVGLQEGSKGRVAVRDLSGKTEPTLPVSLNFSSTTVVNSENALILSGTTASDIDEQNVSATINLNGTLNVRKNIGSEETPDWQYNSLEIASSSAQKAGLRFNVNGEINASTYYQAKNNETNLTGTMNLLGAPVSGDTSVFRVDGANSVLNIKSGGIVNANTSGEQNSYVSAWITEGGTLNIESGGSLVTTSRFKTNNWSATNLATVNILNGGSITANNIWIGSNSAVNIAGNITATNLNSSFYLYGNTTTVTLQKGGTVSSGYLNLAYSTLIVDKDVAEGSWNLNSGNTVKLDNKKARLVLHSSNVFKSQYGGQETVYIEAALGDMYLDVYTNQDFKALRFSNNTTRPNENVYTSDLYFYIDPSVTSITFNSFANDTLWNDTTLEDICQKHLIFDGFRNGVIYIENPDSKIDFSLISSLNGDWVNFRIEDNYLVADYIPEPAEFAALFGILALGLALYRKRK